jgi:hypothetical protein
MALGSTQPPSENEYQEHFLGVKAAGEGDDPTTFMCRMWKSGSLNLLEPSGPHRASYVTNLPFFLLMSGTVHEDVCTFMISHRILLRVKVFSRQICRNNQNTHFMFTNSPPPPESRAVYEVMWKNTVQPDRPQMTMQYGVCSFNAA